MKIPLTAYLLTNWLIWLKEWKSVSDLIPKERISLVATTTKYTKEEVEQILKNADFWVARQILEEKYAWLDYLPGNRNL